MSLTRGGASIQREQLPRASEIANRNDGREPYTGEQYAALARLAAHYLRQGLPPDAFVSHAAIALPAGRKTDPAGFDWKRFRESVRQV